MTHIYQWELFQGFVLKMSIFILDNSRTIFGIQFGGFQVQQLAIAIVLKSEFGILEYESFDCVIDANVMTAGSTVLSPWLETFNSTHLIILAIRFELEMAQLSAERG